MCGHTVDHTAAILSLRLLAAEAQLTFVFVKKQLTFVFVKAADFVLL